MTYTVFIDVEEDIRLKRRILRDTKLRARSEESVKKQFNDSVKPMHEKFIEPTKKFADIIISNDNDCFNKLCKTITKILMMNE